jgi:methylmalonyl-CoA mutase
MATEGESYKSKNPIRVITATSLFDGHDAAINIMRRILQDTGAEVIHLGHNRSVDEIVKAAIEEDVQGIAVSSYQGGHVEFFKYMADKLKEKSAGHIKIFGGGGGVIVPEEIKELESYGITKIYSPADGARMGLQGMINHMMENMDFSPEKIAPIDPNMVSIENPLAIARLLTAAEAAIAENSESIESLRQIIQSKLPDLTIPTIGLTGTGGAGKSSLTDEIVLRLLHDNPDIHIGIICCDPSRRKTGGALLGDRIRMNAIDTPRVFMRSMAVRRTSLELPVVLPDAVNILKAAGMDLIIIETAGIGQGASNIFDLTALSIYVMTSDYGAATQLEKIDMLDFADMVVVNKFDKQGSEDAVRDIRKQVQRNRKAFDVRPEAMPVFGTIAAKFNDDGVTAMYHALLALLAEKTGVNLTSTLAPVTNKTSSTKSIIVSPERIRYLSEIAETVRNYHLHTKNQTESVRNVWHLTKTAEWLSGSSLAPNPGTDTAELLARLKAEIEAAGSDIEPETAKLLKDWEDIKNTYTRDELVYHVRDMEIRQPLYSQSLSGTRIPRIALPGYTDPGEIYTWMRKENIPGRFPYTGGVFPLKRKEEEPTRMFAGEGDPERTNRRFKLLSGAYTANRLSTAFDSVTLYGFDPEIRPDIYGKIGTSGVSVCNLDDVKALYAGFDLAAENTSVSMTVNGPAPMMLAMFFNTAIDQRMDRFAEEFGRAPNEAEASKIKQEVLGAIRGTVQADILKEDQGQNTCIFSIDFALKMMGDIQQYFIDYNVKNFYSVSISGYHIAEAGANPISQLAFTLANGFTYVEYYLSRNMSIDSFAPNLSFFFSSGMDPEYSVIGRVARRIWSVAMKHKYGAAARSQMLKYHIQTSGRSLHSQEIQFNDIRTTLQALYAIYDNCNSLHTNAFDEAITTPSAESVRRSLAIQMIINRELGTTKNENFNQGSFLIDTLTDLVEEAVLAEFDRITSRGGVQGAMERGYQRSKIQEESLYYEYLKHSGELPLIGVNTFINPNADADTAIGNLELARATEEEKQSQLARHHHFVERNKDKSADAIKRLKDTVLSGKNIFGELMHTVRHCTMGQITHALYEVGGQYRRNM